MIALWHLFPRDVEGCVSTLETDALEYFPACWEFKMIFGELIWRLRGSLFWSADSKARFKDAVPIFCVNMHGVDVDEWNFENGFIDFTSNLYRLGCWGLFSSLFVLIVSHPDISSSVISCIFRVVAVTSVATWVSISSGCSQLCFRNLCFCIIWRGESPYVEPCISSSTLPSWVSKPI